MLVKAPPCPAGETTIILGGDQLALQVHESIGHPIELDRVFGHEASFAGKSFLSPDMKGQFRYGSPQVNVTADATASGGLGTFGYDDEGVPAQSTPIIQNGIFRGFLTSRSLAPRINGERSNGTMRADGWQNFPLIRMTNINLEPGEWDYDDLIGDTKEGLLLETNKSWSIDDRRINFQFSTEVAREIKKGKVGRIYRNPIYTGITWDFWRSCDAVCSEDWWKMWGTPNCGKGEPMQTMYVGHGIAPARFHNVQVGSSESK
jgi:TldD protein